LESLYLPQLEILGQIALAMVLGAVIGLDREFARKPAGLRTHMLVAGAAALIVKLSEISLTHFQPSIAESQLQVDPTRIFVAVVTGISFLGAGTIIRQSSSRKVEGLTTAASLLILCSNWNGYCIQAVYRFHGATLIAVLVLWTMTKIETVIRKCIESGDNEV
jgi:putative Mg2+ transporter-C (MgtC) family protein